MKTGKKTNRNKASPTLYRQYRERKGPASIAVFSLEKNCGASHLSEALSLYYRQTETEVLDLGRLQDGAGRLLEAQVRIAACVYRDTFLFKLADFTQKYVDDPGRWIFCFNFVKRRDARKVRDVMEGYQTAILPVAEPQEMQRFIYHMMKEAGYG